MAQTTTVPDLLDCLYFPLMIMHRQGFHFLDSDSNIQDEVTLFISSTLFVTKMFNFRKLVFIQWRNTVEYNQKLVFTFFDTFKSIRMWWNNLALINARKISKLGWFIFLTSATLDFEITKFEWYYSSKFQNVHK